MRYVVCGVIRGGSSPPLGMTGKMFHKREGRDPSSFHI